MNHEEDMRALAADGREMGTHNTGRLRKCQRPGQETPFDRRREKPNLMSILVDRSFLAKQRSSEPELH